MILKIHPVDSNPYLMEVSYDEPLDFISQEKGSLIKDLEAIGLTNWDNTILGKSLFTFDRDQLEVNASLLKFVLKIHYPQAIVIEEITT